jgi:ADP-ribose pyrophosphatase
VLSLSEVSRLQRDRDGAADHELIAVLARRCAIADLPIPRVIATERVLDRSFIGLRLDTLAYGSDDDRMMRAVVEYGQSVALVAVDAEGHLLLVRQYRHPAGRWLLEIPAGGIDEHDASPEAAAQRELQEETGYRGTLTKLGGFFLACGYSDEYMHVFLAEDLKEDPLPGDDDEDLHLERVQLNDALSMLDAGELGDAKTVASLMLYARYRDQTVQ